MQCTFSINPEPTDSVGELFIHTSDKSILVFESLTELETFGRVVGICAREIRESYPNVK